MSMLPEDFDLSSPMLEVTIVFTDPLRDEAGIATSLDFIGILGDRVPEPGVGNIFCSRLTVPEDSMTMVAFELEGDLVVLIFMIFP